MVFEAIQACISCLQRGITFKFSTHIVTDLAFKNAGAELWLFSAAVVNVNML